MNKSFVGLLVLLVLNGCSTGVLTINIDPELLSNSDVFEINQSSILSKNGEAISFGPYKAANFGWIKTTKASRTEMLWMNRILNIDIPDTTKIKLSVSHNYKFSTDNGDKWKAECVLLSNQREHSDNNLSILQTLSFYYSCEYTHPDHDSWVFSIQQNGSSKSTLEMGNSENLFTANADKGVYMKPDGSSSNMMAPADTGFTWVENNNVVAAFTVLGKTPKVWLDKNNSQELNNMLSMASASYLVYKWKILPGLNN